MTGRIMCLNIVSVSATGSYVARDYFSDRKKLRVMALHVRVIGPDVRRENYCRRHSKNCLFYDGERRIEPTYKREVLRILFLSLTTGLFLICKYNKREIAYFNNYSCYSMKIESE